MVYSLTVLRQPDCLHLGLHAGVRMQPLLLTSPCACCVCHRFKS